MKLQSISCVSAAATFAGAASNSTSYGQPIMIDTDIMSDVDDVGSLTVANVLHNCGLADLRGISINTHSKYGSLAASALCTYFDNGDVPIAAIRPITDEVFFDNSSYTHGEYASKVAYNWPRKLKNAHSTPTPVELYRSVLSSAADKSMHLISIGFLTNLADLLKSKPDSTSHLSGPALISAKVSELIVMGGQYPSGWEFNFGGGDPESTIYLLHHWPKDVPITFSGYELGGNVLSGQHLKQDSPPNSPILAAYEWYVTRCSTIRESWDPITTLYGILGLDGFTKLGMKPPLAFGNKYGYNSITSRNASNTWVYSKNVTNQHYLRMADGVTHQSMAWLLDQFFVHDPVMQDCFGYKAARSTRSML